MNFRQNFDEVLYRFVIGILDVRYMFDVRLGFQLEFTGQSINPSITNKKSNMCSNFGYYFLSFPIVAYRSKACTVFSVGRQETEHKIPGLRVESRRVFRLLT